MVGDNDMVTRITEVGFTVEKAELALRKTGWKGAEAAIDWLLSQENKGKECTEKISNLQPVDKSKKVKELEELRIIKRKEREEKEKKDEIERERRRIEDGKALASIRNSFEEKEMKKIIDDCQKEKVERERARKQVLVLIKADKEARKGHKECKGSNEEIPHSSSSNLSHSNFQKKKYEEARIQIRLLNGSTLVQTFSVDEPLSAVRLFTSVNGHEETSQSSFKFMTSFPKIIFSEEDYDKSLEALGLVPSAVLTVIKS